MNRLELGLRQRNKTRLIFLSDRDGQVGADGGFVGVLPAAHDGGDGFGPLIAVAQADGVRRDTLLLQDDVFVGRSVRRPDEDIGRSRATSLSSYPPSIAST